MGNLHKVQFLLALSCLIAATSCLADSLVEEHEQPLEPFVPEKTELFRFSRSAKGGLFAKYEQRKQEQREQQQQQQQEQQLNEGQSPQVEVNREPIVAAQMPSFSSAGESKGSRNGELPETPNLTPSFPTSSFPSSNSPSSNSKSLAKTITKTTTTTTHQLNQDQPTVAQLKEIRVHTVPLSEAVHYANYVVVPSAAANKAARLEESSSSSSHKSSSSSSTTREETESVAVPQQPLLPAPVPVGPDCVLQRLIVERPVHSSLVINVPSEVSVSRSHSSQVVESSAIESPAPVVAPICCITKKVAPVFAAKLVVPPPPVNDGHVKEEHFHTESRSSREQSLGLGHSSSSSSSSSSSRTSKSSSSTTSQTAALMAPPVQTVTVTRQMAPLIAYRSAPLVAFSPIKTNDYSVNVDHHYSGPNVKYGYSIKQQSSEPETKGLVVGERVVYLK